MGGLAYFRMRARAVGQGLPPPVLGSLTLSDDSWPYDTPEDSILGTILGKTADSTLSIPPGEARWYIDEDGESLLRGPGAWTDGAATVRIYETPAGGSNYGNYTDISCTIEEPIAQTVVVLSATAVNWAENVPISYPLETNVATTKTITGGADAAAFSIVGGNLTAAGQDFDASDTRVVNVTFTPSAGDPVEETFTFTIQQCSVTVHSANAVTKQTNNSNLEETLTIDVPVGANRGIVLVVSGTDCTARLGPSSNFTVVATTLSGSENPTQYRIFTLAAPPLGNGQTITVTRTAGSAGTRWYMLAVPISNWDQQTPQIATALNQANLTSYSFNGLISTTSDDLMHMTFAALSQVTITATGIASAHSSSGETLVTSLQANGSSVVSCLFAKERDAGNQDMAFSLKVSGSDVTLRWASVATIALRGVPYQAVDPIFCIANDGNDSNDGTTEEAPWASLDRVKTYIAGGLAPGVKFRFKNGQRHRRTSYDATTQTGEFALNLISLGTAANPVVVEGYGAGDPFIIGGDVLYPTGWTTASDLNGKNANYASIVKRTFSGTEALNDPSQFPMGGGRMMWPAQWAKGVDTSTYAIRRFQLSDAGSANWHHPPPEDMQSVIGTSPVFEPDKPIRVEKYTNGSGQPRYRNYIQYSEIAARYTDVNELVGHTLVFRQAGTNSTTELPITSYDKDTGTIMVDSDVAGYNSDTYTARFHTSDFYWSIRYHPRDIGQQGQYALTADRSVMYGWFWPGEKSVARRQGGVRLSGSYINFNGDVEGCGVASGSTLLSALHNVSDNSTVTFGVRQCIAGRGYGSDTNDSDLAVNNVVTIREVDDLSFDSATRLFRYKNNTLNYLRVKHSAAGRTTFYQSGDGTENTTPSYNYFSNIIAAQHKARHGNFDTTYGSSALSTSEQCICTGATTGITSSGTPYGGVKGVVRRRMFITGTRSIAPPGAAEWGNSTPLCRLGKQENQSVFDRLMLFFCQSNAFNLLDQSAGFNDGMVVSRCIIDSMALEDLAGQGVIVRDCMLLRVRTSSASQSHVEANADVARCEWMSATTSWHPTENFDNGVLTTKMQEFLTRAYSTPTALDFNPASPVYENVTLFEDALDGWTWTIPAYGSSFALTDLRLDGQTPGTNECDLHINTQAYESLATVLGWRPGSTLSLPSGVDDNNDFFIERGVICPYARLTANKTITVRETNSAATGGTTRDTQFRLLVS